ncbi:MULTISPECIES: cytidylyltransferase domain-containing protein [Lysinibacillus]|uniref:acylneuraminate cytidylyltransferase family protein n=1 Tax=Lysinibacillus TaxID=400634 RepID=UPI00257C4E7E|nr:MULTISPECIES: hypothetical protein [Lysinibacillus]
MKVHAFVPAKSVSNRVQNKNQLKIFGEALYVNALKTLSRSTEITNFYIDTESENFINHAVSKVSKCSAMKRDLQYATNETDGNQLLLNEANFSKADIYVQLLCTSPFISIETIDKGIRILKENQEYDSVVAVRREKLYLWDESGPQYDINNIPNSNTLSDTIIETMGLYIIRHETLISTKKRIGNKPYLLEVSQLEGIDINYPEDYEFAQIIERGLRG